MGNVLAQQPGQLSASKPVVGYKQEVRICLACHRDNSDGSDQNYTSNIKQIIRKFARDVYNTNTSTIMLWATWDIDTDSADIVRRPSTRHVVPYARNAFDVIVSTYCIFGVYEQDLDDVYRLLKPGGMFLLLGFGDNRFGLEASQWHDAFEPRYEFFGRELRLEHEEYALVPVNIIQDPAQTHPFVVLQKLKISTRSDGQRFYI